MKNNKLRLIQKINSKLRYLLSKTHKKEMDLTCNNAQETPTFFNHFIDIYYQLFWSKKTDFLTRGVFNQLFLDSSNTVLELGCGDGYNTQVFFAPAVKEIYAIDLSESAIQFAKTNHPANNIMYKLADAVADYPTNMKYDRVICDCFIEQLAASQQEELFKKIAASLSLNGICLGSTVLKTELNYLSHNKHEFSDAAFSAFSAKFFKYSFTISRSVGNKNYKYFALSNQPFTHFELVKND